MLVLSAVAFQAWFIAHAAAVRSQPMVSAVTAAAMSPRSTASVPVAASTPRTASGEPVRVEALPLLPVVAPAFASQQPSSRRFLQGDPAPERVAVAGAARAHRPAQASDPLAGCRSMWLFARAACLQNSCAQGPLKRHPQCQEVVAQRRLDEARRDGILAN